MTATVTTLEISDTLHFYVFFANLPIFVHGMPQTAKNRLIVLNTHHVLAQQS